MKILKPDNLALVYRALRFARRDTLAVGMIAGFRFEPAGLDGLMTEDAFWPVVAAALGKDAILDEGYPKPAGEYKVYGAAHAPAGTQVAEMRAGVRIGALSKALIVLGDREFNALGAITAPKPYARMPIAPATAFGGAGCVDNPYGKGFAEIVNDDGTRAWPLPNVEAEGQRFLRRGERAVPAGFWGFDMAAPLRQQHLGACDERWVKEEWPHLPSDTRPELFLSAPLDQRLSGYFAGDERFELDNLHPHARRLGGSLPALRARCFVNVRTSAGEVLRELQTRAETVWLFPEFECGAVLYRALADVADADGSDVLHVMAEWERMDEAPLPFEHYRARLHELLTQAAGAAPAATPAFAPEAGAPVAAAQPAAAVPLAAAASAAAVADLALAAEPHLAIAHALAEELNAESRARMQQHNLTDADIARFLKPEAPERTYSLAEVEQMAERLNAESRARMQQHNLTDADIARFLKADTPERVPTLAEIGKMADDVKIEARALMQQHNLTEADVARMLPAETAAALGPLSFAGGEAQSAFAALGAVLKPPSPPALELSGKLPEAAAAALPVQAAAPLTREDVIARHAARQSLAGYDLSGLDLSGLDLSGADFSGAALDKTSFAKSRLDGADFTQALLRETDFSDAALQRAQLGKVSAANATFANADLREAQLAVGDFTGADFSAAQLASADLRRAVFDTAKMPGVDASACRAEHASFTGCDLANAKFGGAALAKASFSGSRIAGSDFSAAACQQAEFYGADAQAAQFAGANLNGSRADADTRFDEVRFTRTQLNRACWEGVQLRGAKFEEAVLDYADFSGAQAQAAQFGMSSAKGARLANADLSGANLDAVNLFGGSLRKANVSGAHLRFANLYGVDFDGTRPTVAMLEGSNIDCTILQFRPPVL
ncbi:DUF2169 family type VI secretion system accessory protein [Paraburkholderia sacchari]|uniref:DUF2169 family type VI secretion system accessory protein n=1 Tax=Paraburkholderia sacchari TaxID=159450 RepID=UPI0005434A35|nr:DUF2169 domain-containing protein [Paraburkholderia sacchari]NLP62653.1 DUF2169 domain-containing protein [Paraburkholderia sacchari]